MSVVPQQFEDGLDGLDLLGLSAHLAGQHQKLLPQPVVALAPLLLDQTRDVFNLTQARSGQLLTQFYSVDFSKSRIDVKKCVFSKRTTKACVSCC